MTRFILAAGVAALALTAPAASAPGGHGGQGHAQKAKSERTQVTKARGGNGGAVRSAKIERGHAMRVAFADKPHGPKTDKAQARERQAARADHARTMRELRSAARNDRAVARVERGQAKRDNAAVLAAERRNVIRARDLDKIVEPRFAERAVGYGVGGCPPGLAKKAVPCMPPGQARKLVGQPINTLARTAAFSALPVRLQGLYPDTPDYYYRYGNNGYLYQVNRETQLVNSLLPLFGLGYGIGQPFPTAYPAYGLPMAYQPFYPDTPYTSYRYANGYVYQIDPITGLIEDVDPMLGYGYGYGQMLPATYSAYNVPYQYRPLYYDTSDAYYRYAPGAIYQVDPQTSLITAIASLLAPGLTVGQPLPLGYSAYNVPFDYRAQYYDTPNAMYRYSNGYIYRVDPATQLVTAIVASILT